MFETCPLAPHMDSPVKASQLIVGTRRQFPLDH